MKAELTLPAGNYVLTPMRREVTDDFDPSSPPKETPVAQAFSLKVSADGKAHPTEVVLVPLR